MPKPTDIHGPRPPAAPRAASAQVGAPDPAAGRPRGAPSLRRSHPVATAFLDETGAIAADRIFAVGLLKSPEPSRLLRSIQKLRDQRHWYKEIKFSQVTAGTLGFYKDVVDVVMGNDVEFYCFVADRHVHDPVERFGSQWDAYAKLAEQLVTASIHPPELLTLMADNYSTPDHVLFEEDLRANVNRRLRRLAVVSVCRLDSKASDGLQAVDLLTSAAASEFRADAGLAATNNPKGKLAEHVRESLGTDSCLGGWRNRQHSIQVYGNSA